MKQGKQFFFFFVLRLRLGPLLSGTAATWLPVLAASQAHVWAFLLELQGSSSRHGGGGGSSSRMACMFWFKSDDVTPVRELLSWHASAVASCQLSLPVFVD